MDQMPGKRTLALFVIVLGAIAVFLYVILPRPVHDGRPPSALDRLVVEGVPKSLAPFAFVDAKGRRETLSGFRGRIVILDVWASWCAPCVRELPALGRLEAELPAASYAVIAIDAEKVDAAQTESFLQTHGAGDLSPYRDTELAALDVFGAQGLPFSVIFDAQGRQIAHATGPLDWDSPKTVAYLKTLAGR